MTNPWGISLMVGLGGFAGSVARYGLSVTSQRFSIEWPIGTLAANVLGCLAIGIIMGLSARGETLSPEMRLALATGFCGGFTTLSSMIYETAEMIRASEYLHATLYTAGTFLISMAAFIAGVMAVRILFRMGREIMQLKSEAKLLRIFLGEADKVKHTALYEAIVREARKAGLAGATVWRGIMGFGPTSRIRTTRILDLSTDLPIIVEIADEEEKINQFLPILNDLFESAQSGGLVTVENVKVIKYLHAREDS